MTLFRKEALENVHYKEKGQLLKANLGPRRGGVIAICLALILLLLALSFGSYSRRARVSGALLPAGGVVAVTANAPGVLAQKPFAEGDAVAKGDVLAVIYAPRQTALGDSREVEQRYLREKRESFLKERLQLMQISKANERAYADRLSLLEDTKARLIQQSNLQERRISIAQAELERHERLEGSGYISVFALDGKKSALIEQQLQFEDLKKNAIEIQRQIASVKAEKEQLSPNLAKSLENIDRELASLEQARSAVEAERQFNITAPVPGRIAAYTTELGQPLAANQTIATIVPDDRPLEVALIVPSDKVGFIEKGQRVYVRVQAFPYQKYGHIEAEVQRRSLAPLTVGQIGSMFGGSANVSNGDGAYLVVARVKKVRRNLMDQELLPGLAVEADVVLESRRLYEWALGPLISAARRMANY